MPATWSRESRNVECKDFDVRGDLELCGGFQVRAQECYRVKPHPAEKVVDEALARGREALRATVSESLNRSEVTAIAGLGRLKRKG
jgi:hypothetical protein